VHKTFTLPCGHFVSARNQANALRRHEKRGCLGRKVKKVTTK
jgi:hypothetical protein